MRNTMHKTSLAPLGATLVSPQTKHSLFAADHFTLVPGSYYKNHQDIVILNARMSLKSN